ncbi:hypothetical protein DPSP01_003309 [Paraphaeosphaeria sporulosa]
MSRKTEKSTQSIGLNTVPGDIHHLILSELKDSPSSALRNVSQSSKTLQDVGFSFMYRNLILCKPLKGGKELLAYESLLDRFRGATAGDIARHVRSITVKNHIPQEDLILIVEKIAEFGTLREVNWNTCAHIPEEVLIKLVSAWPDLEISATVIDRHETQVEAHRSMDFKLLSSPLLTRLTYIVYDHGSSEGDPSRSEWPQLSQALAGTSNLRYLSIQSEPDQRGRFGKIVEDTVQESIPRLDLSFGANFSRLEYLSIRTLGYTSYAWDEEYCRTLRDTTHLSRLRSLDFGLEDPGAFFTIFSGHLPKLESLRFGVTRASSLELARDFMDSLNPLTSLHIDNAKRGLDVLWPVIYKHRETLRTLVLGPSWGPYCSAEYTDDSLLETVPVTFPKLERLGWSIPFNAINDEGTLPVLSKMNLRKLDLYMDLPSQASEYSEALQGDAMSGSNNPPLKRSQSIAAATRIADKISQKQKDPLEWLTVRISRSFYMDRFQPYNGYTAFQLRRQERPSAKEEKYCVRGNMNWRWNKSPFLSEELLFEEVN